jgi:hypothetical protein
MSIDLDGYERLGDLERPFELNAKDDAASRISDGCVIPCGVTLRR